MAATDRKNGSVADIRFGATTVTVAAPTVAQVTALTAIECGIVDGPEAPRTGSQIDISGLCDTTDRNKAGNRSNGPITMTLWREFDGTDAYWTLFDDATLGTQYLVVARGGLTAGTPTIGDKVDVYTVEVMAREPSAPVRNEAQRFTVEMAITDTKFSVAIVA